VAVGVGLHHREDADSVVEAGRDPPGIVHHGGEVDLGPRGSDPLLDDEFLHAPHVNRAPASGPGYNLTLILHLEPALGDF
jgi:hypothetical protein